jgi:hypothetical protein
MAEGRWPDAAPLKALEACLAQRVLPWHTPYPRELQTGHLM